MDPQILLTRSIYRFAKFEKGIKHFACPRGLLFHIKGTYPYMNKIIFQNWEYIMETQTIQTF